MRKIILSNFVNSAINIATKQVWYKFQSDLCGIYIIKNKITNECYIGQSTCIKRRLQDHKNKLKNNKHLYSNGERTLLQNAWNKYGEENFVFDFLELCNKNELNEKEIFWIDFYKCNRTKYGSGYNLNDGGAGQHLEKGTGNTGKILVNNGEKQIFIFPWELDEYQSYGYIKGMLPENIKKIQENTVILHGKDHPNYGKKWSNETRKKIEAYHASKPNIVLPHKGVPMSEERKKHLSEKLKGKSVHQNSLKALQDYMQKHKKPVIQLTLDGIYINEFESIKKAYEITGVSKGNIVSCCKGIRKHAGGYLWRYKYDY